MAFELPFFSKTPPLIGLDIGSSSVKLVELSEAGGTLRLERYAIEPLPRGAVVDGNIDKIDLVAEAVKRAWRRSGTRIKNVAMALPASAVITKRIALPANLREEELEMQVESEANQYIPFSLDEVSAPLLVADQAHDPEAAAEARLSGPALRALMALPPEFRAPVILVDLHGFSYDDAAQVLHCPVGTVRSRLHRARLALREWLRPHLETLRSGSG